MNYESSEAQAMKDLVSAQHEYECRTTPVLAAVSHAGWKLWCTETYTTTDKYGEQDIHHTWIAANSITGRVVEFSTNEDELKPDYEHAAFTLKVLGYVKGDEQ